MSWFLLHINAECDVPGVITDFEKAIDVIVYYSNPEDFIGMGAGVPLNSVMDSKYELGKEFTAKMISLYNSGALGSFTTKSQGAPTGNARYFRGQYRMKRFDSVTMSFLMSYDKRKKETRIQVPIVFNDSRKTFLLVSPSQESSEECEFGPRLSKVVNATANVTTILQERRILQEIKQQSISRGKVPFIDKQVNAPVYQLGGLVCSQLPKLNGCSLAEPCEVPSECYGGDISGVKIFTLDDFSFGNEFGSNFVSKHMRASHNLNEEAALTHTSGKRGIINTLNPHEEPSSALTLVVVAVSALGTAALTFFERKREVMRTAQHRSGSSMYSISVPLFGFIILVFIDGVALVIGLMIEKRVREWDGIDLVCLLRISDSISASQCGDTSQHIFTVIYLVTEYTKINTLYRQYLGVTVIYVAMLILATTLIVKSAGEELHRIQSTHKPSNQDTESYEMPDTYNF